MDQISLLVDDGVRTVDEMQRHLRTFVEREKLPGGVISKENQRFYPTKKTIRNHM